MPSFRYVAVDRAGQRAEGFMEAPDAGHVIASLQRAGCIPMLAELAKRRSFPGGLAGVRFGRTGLRRQEVANMTRELSIMLGAGQDLDRALRFLIGTAREARVKTLYEQLRAAVRDGGSMAAALARHPKTFSKLYVGLIRAGEAGGALAPTLERLAALLEGQRRLTATVRSAMIYPGLMALVATGSVTLLLTVVLPQFVPLFAQNGSALPGSMIFLLGLGAFVANDGIYVALGGILLWLAARHWLRRDRPRLAAARLILRLPVIGALQREVLAARFTRTLGSLLLNGVPLIAALEIVRQAIDNRAAAEAVALATTSARNGAGLAKPLAATGIFPDRTVHLLQLGEETAQIGAIALRAADIHDEAVHLGVQRLVSLLVPVITILMGAMIGAIVSTLMLAMLSLNNLAG